MSDSFFSTKNLIHFAAAAVMSSVLGAVSAVYWVGNYAGKKEEQFAVLSERVGKLETSVIAISDLTRLNDSDNRRMLNDIVGRLIRLETTLSFYVPNKAQRR